MEIMSRTAPISIKILAQFLPENKASAKIKDTAPSTIGTIPNPPRNTEPTAPVPNMIRDPIICNIARIVTPVGLSILAGAAELNLISPQDWQYDTPASFGAPHF